MRPRRPQPHTLAGAYALDALDHAGGARFERHLARCQECAREVAGLREAAAALAAAAAVRPPAGLRRQVLAGAARTRQSPPVAGWSRPTRRPAPRAARRSCGWVARLPLAPRLALALAGVLLVTTAGVWATGHLGRHRAGTGQPAVAAVLTAPDATMLGVGVATGGHATVVMSHRERALVFAAAGLRALPPSRRYELWLLGRDGDRPAGLLPMPRHGMTGPAVASGLAPGDRLGLTVEPAHGSPRPTSPMIINLTL